ncbi:MAG: RIP metalloprotease RseP [Clostridia bacterium]|nr:RIP metalloprotease RseP [Clostridia bacterium]
MLEGLKTILYIGLAILILLFMITVHEFGHYIVGKIFRFKINEFAIGMGPCLFKRKSKKTGEIFSIRIFPLGGYCAFEGEDDDSENEHAFNNKAPYKRILVLIAGATMNLIFGILILMLSIGIYGQLLVQTYDIKLDTTYQEYSLKNDDIIVAINNKNVFMSSDVATILTGKKQGDIVEVKVKVNENGTYKTVTRQVKLRNDVTSGNLTDVFSAFESLGIATIIRIDEVGENSSIIAGETYLQRLNTATSYEDCERIFNIQTFIDYAKTFSMGDTLSVYVSVKGASQPQLIEIPVSVDLQNLDNERVLNALGIKAMSKLLKYSTFNTHFSFFETIGRTFEYSVNIAGTIFRTLGELLTGKLGMSAVGGPITTITTTASAIEVGGFNYFLEIAGFIGINLAVFNLLPIPALDGSRVVFCLIEWIRKKPINKKVEGIIHGVGLILLLGFCVLVDILQLF